jgi:hypothetical protein
MCASSCGRAEAFFSASDAAVWQEVADGKISAQTACALTQCIYVYISNMLTSPLAFSYLLTFILSASTAALMAGF